MKLESNFSRLLKGSDSPGERKIRNEVYVFVICLVISVFIWFLIAISKEVYTALEYPVKFVHPPADMVLVNSPDSVLTFRISSGGFEMLTLRYLTPKKPIEIDLRNMSLEQQDGYFTGVFNTSRLSADIRKQYRFSEELVSISPENIYFRFENLSGKMVPVVSGLKLEFQQQFRLADTIRFDPPQVKVVGPRNLIDRIDYVITQGTVVSGIGGPVSGNSKLAKPFGNDQLALVPDQVGFSLDVERFTESTLTLPVLAPEGDAVLKTFPEKVTITFLVSLDNFKRVTPDLFSAIAELPDSAGNTAKARVRISKSPAFVDVTRIDPPEVDFLILQK